MNKKQLEFFTAAFAILLFTHSTPGYTSNPPDLSTIFIVDCHAEKDYSLNTYYLFNQQPVFDAHTAALKQTEFLLQKISKIKTLYATTPLKQQHSFYIPVSFKPQSWVLQPTKDDFPAAARWILHNYDYQCAKKLLKPFSTINAGGPYFLSSLEKLKANPEPNVPWRSAVLIQNLSDIEYKKSLFWLSTFFKKSWQPRLWNLDDISLLQEGILEELKNNDNLPNSDAMGSVSLSTPKALSTPASGKFSIAQYPVNELQPQKPNPYSSKITIQYRQETNETTTNEQ